MSFIEQCFTMAPGIGPKAEEKIKSIGYQSWENIIADPQGLPLSSEKKSGLVNTVLKCQRLKEEGSLSQLIQLLPTKEHWRVFFDYSDKASYFDIETTGISLYDDEPTVIGCYHQDKMLVYLNGDNLDDFLDLLHDVELLVSFNGTSFDVPFVQEHFHIPTLPCPHVDLRWICHHKGLKGSLKQIEKDIGLVRDDGVEGVDGREAIILWQKYKLYGMESALKKLVDYCCADVLGLVDLGKEIKYH